MGRFSLDELPPALTGHVARDAALEFPTQGKTSDVAFAAHDGRDVVVKRCAHRVYIEWLRREHRVLRALAASELPIPRVVAYAETEVGGAPVGWLLTTRLPGRSLLGRLRREPEPTRAALMRGLGELLRRLHATAVPPELREPGDWTSRQLEQAHANLSWCDGTAVGLAELERSRPPAVAECLIHGDLALDNVLVDEHGEIGLIDWAGGGPGDARHDIALALQTKPEVELTAEAFEAFHAGYGSARSDAATLDWFVRLYDYF